MKAARCSFVLPAVLVFAAGASAQVGERPAISSHMDQADIDAGLVTFDEIFTHGEMFFKARFNALDGATRPGTTGGGAPRVPDQPTWIRTSAPDTNSCFGCHNIPSSGGAGEFGVNVFVLAQTLDPVTFSVAPEFSNERNTLGMHGSGPIEMLAREMTVELHAIRDEAKATALATGIAQTRALVVKGVSFGSITVLPDGKIDPSAIEGVDWDLIIKPFHQKGAVISLREFTNNAMNHHHGIQTVERFGADVDPDLDGHMNEMTDGDVTATAIYQAALGVPGRVIPSTEERKEAARVGRDRFNAVGCSACHIPNMVLNSQLFTEPNPFNPAGNRKVGEIGTFTYNMTTQGQGPLLEALSGGRAVVRAFTDLKRHNLNDDDFSHFANELVPQGKLNGTAPASDFTIEPPVRPTNQFLTRKLWDVGNTDPYGHRGDLTIMTEAINFHGGDARASRDAFFALPQSEQDSVIEYLKSLRILPKGSPIVIQESKLK